MVSKGSVPPNYKKTIFTYLPPVVSRHADSCVLVTLSAVFIGTIYSVESSLETLILERHTAVGYF